MPDASDVDTVFVVGGGLSSYAGLPLTSEFTKALLAARKQKTGQSRHLVDYLARFTRDVFGHLEGAKAEYWPSLEDLFTCLDLAANTGHHLGSAFPPARLRTVRRALLVRIMRMLEDRYHRARQRKTEKWKMLGEFFRTVDFSRAAFISMNWDTVIERRFWTIHKTLNFDYGCDAVAARFPGEASRIEVMESTVGQRVGIIKIHGSFNWLYCDNCRRVFWFAPWKQTEMANQLLSRDEWKQIAPHSDYKSRIWNCAFCGDVPLGIRIATFSYRKALDFPMLQKSWFSAEKLLRQARSWVFIGYSMPAADFEFKFTLKRVQLSRRIAPKFALIAGGRDADSTYTNYQRFFGRGVRLGDNCFLEGLTTEAIAYIRELSRVR